MRVSVNVSLPRPPFTSMLTLSLPSWNPGVDRSGFLLGLLGCCISGELEGPLWKVEADGQLPGSMASERATGLTSHLEAMGCRKSARVMQVFIFQPTPNKHADGIDHGTFPSAPRT